MIASLYRSGDSWLHRCPAIWKLLTLVITGICMALPFGRWWLIGVLTPACAIAFVSAGFGFKEYLRQIWMARWVIAFTVLAQVFFQPWPRTVANTVRVLDLVLLAALITLSTPVSELLDGMLHALRPLDALGIRSDSIALVAAITMNAIPLVNANMRAVREAHAARGGRGGIMAWAVPLLVISLKQANELAAAMDARGL